MSGQNDAESFQPDPLGQWVWRTQFKASCFAPGGSDFGLESCDLS